MNTLATTVFPLIFAVAVSSHASADEATVEGFWVTQSLHISSRFGHDCLAIRDAVDTVLPAVEARAIEVKCRVQRGADIGFESVAEQPAPETDSVPVAAAWRSKTIQQFRSGPDCFRTSELIDLLLDLVAVRNLTSSVFCDGYNGHLFYSFEALVPAETEEDRCE